MLVCLIHVKVVWKRPKSPSCFDCKRVKLYFSRMWDHWFEQTQLAWAGRDEMNGHVVNLNVKLDCIMEQLRRMSLPTPNNLY